MNLNKAFIIGNLTRDPEVRTLPSGLNVASFGMATNRFYTGKDGQKQQEVQFHNIVAFGKLADIAKKFLTKGSLVMIEGRLQHRTWDGQDGQKKNRTEIVVQSMQMGPRGAKTGAPETAAPQPKEKEKEELDTIDYGEEEINPDEIPF